MTFFLDRPRLMANKKRFINLKIRGKSFMNNDHSLKVENAVVKERETNLREDNDRLKNELESQEQRYQQRRDETL